MWTAQRGYVHWIPKGRVDFTKHFKLIESFVFLLLLFDINERTIRSVPSRYPISSHRLRRWWLTNFTTIVVIPWYLTFNESIDNSDEFVGFRIWPWDT